jgi:hypothetical protein
MLPAIHGWFLIRGLSDGSFVLRIQLRSSLLIKQPRYSLAKVSSAASPIEIGSLDDV